MKPLALILFVGCVKAPDLVIVDRKTALEQQAAGSFRGLEDELERAGIVPGPVPLTGAQLETAGVRPEAEADDAEGLPDALRADGLLVQRCIGEAKDGLFALTIDRCTGTIDVARVNRLIERVNRQRRQVWRWLAQRHPERSPDEIQRAWRKTHVEGVVCGGQMQTADGAWEVKAC
jgi:hypothetical protein